MTKEEVKKRLELGTIQIENDAPDSLELLKELGGDWISGGSMYYIANDCQDVTFQNLPIIKLSEIEEEVQWQYLLDDKWHDVSGQYRIKPQPDYTNEIEVLQNKAKENGQKVVIVFEKA